MARTYYFSVIFVFLIHFFLFSSPFSLSGAPRKKCTVCSRSIKYGTYYTGNGRIYCSEKCINNAKPKCSLCKKSLDTYIQAGIPPANYCTTCFHTPRCFFCSRPAGRRGQLYKIAPQMLLCRNCGKNSVSNQSKALASFRILRKQLMNVLKVGTDHKINFLLTAFEDLRKNCSGSLHTGQTGLYVCKTMIQTTKKIDPRTGKTLSTTKKAVQKDHFIYILSSLPHAEFRQTVIHELTHDWLGEYYPHITDAQIQEGVCEYMAYLFLEDEKNNDPHIRSMLSRMEKNPDPVYGGGFRLIRKKAGSGSKFQRLAKLKKFLAQKQ